MATSLDHLFLRETTTSSPFKSPRPGGSPTLPTPNRDTHSQRLLRQLAQLRRDEARIKGRRKDEGRPVDAGIKVAIEIRPSGSLDVGKKLEWRRDGIEVLSVNLVDGADVVVVRIPPGKLAAFERRVQEYQNEDGKPDKDGNRKPKNAALINVITAFDLASFDELWTDDDPPPEPETESWFQVWLRLMPAGPAATQAAFEAETDGLDIVVEPGYVTFPGRVVVAVQATREVLAESLQLLDMVAEIRGVQPTAEFFLSELTTFEQVQWVADLRARRQLPQADANSYVTLLDTGVNNGHRLLNGLVDDADLHAVNPDWQGTDHEGHGTSMAGLSLLGELSEHLAGDEQVEIPHRLESVKIWPPTGANAPHLYGEVTSQAVTLVEDANLDRDRTFAMMTTTVGNTRGRPTEWSALVDRLAFGLGRMDETPDLPQDLHPKLFVLAAGNVQISDWTQYPAVNHTSTVEDPGQAWNAITVGACTDLTAFNEAENPSLTAIAERGGLAPASRTSRLWDPVWPYKPDVLAEGGNGTRCSVHGDATDGPSALRLLTTSHVAAEPLTETGDTSAATAEVARICGNLRARYPDYWPETHRALIVHGARWSQEMRRMLPSNANMREKAAFLRTFGYGTANLARSAGSLLHRPTLIVQETITPYVEAAGGVSLGNLNIHDLPWPTEKLGELGGSRVELRVTLSYFIEPNPARRGWQSNFRYQSHGLRFAIKAATETLETFTQRINKLERDAEQGVMTDADLDGWTLGPNVRSRGSLHSDIWTGTAAALAAKSHIAIFPVGGWWKDWKDSKRASRDVRYSLAITLRVVDDVDVDIYTPIANQIGIEVPVA